MNDIDIVITWVDGNDNEWLKEYNKYKPIGSKKNVRFENTCTLLYLFRGIEKYLPWVHNVYLVTSGHYPKWLNINHPKLHLVSHNDIFPDKKHLPTFNSSAIEMNLHNIKGLSEKFIYFNDDMLVLKKLNKDYFFKNDKPNDFFIVKSLFHDKDFSHLLHSDMQIINKEIQKDKTIKKLIFKTLNFKYGIKNSICSFLLIGISKQIPLFLLYHHPQAHLKSNFVEVEKAYSEIVNQTRSHKFRSPLDINQYIFRFWGLIKGKYNPTYHNDSQYVGVNDLAILRVQLNKLKNKNISMICLNEEDGFPIDKYEEYKKIIKYFLDIKLSKKSLYEK